MRVKPSTCILIAILAVLALLAGCGSGKDESASSDSATTSADVSTDESAAAHKEAPAQESAGKDNQGDNGSEGAKGTKGGSKGPGAAGKGKPPERAHPPVPTEPKSLPNEGTAAVAPEVPTNKGGDNSIQEYGVEAPSPERVEVASTTQAYLSAQAGGRWAEACSYLWAPIRERVELHTDGSDASDKEGCADAMATLLSKAPQTALQRAAEIDVLSMRVQGNRGFVIYRDGSGKPFNLPLVNAGGEWKITSLAGIGLVL